MLKSIELDFNPTRLIFNHPAPVYDKHREEERKQFHISTTAAMRYYNTVFSNWNSNKDCKRKTLFIYLSHFLCKFLLWGSSMDSSTLQIVLTYRFFINFPIQMLNTKTFLVTVNLNKLQTQYVPRMEKKKRSLLTWVILCSCSFSLIDRIDDIL